MCREIGGLKVFMFAPSPYQIGKYWKSEFARGGDFDPDVFLNYLFEVVKLQRLLACLSLTLSMNAHYLVATQTPSCSYSL